ncbi:MAG: two-component regulator propeller domain-containing protein [Bacteroidia bacterium]
MTKYYLHKPIYSLLFILTFLTSCNGQTKTRPLVDNGSELKALLTGQPKLTKTQGSNEYTTVMCGIQDKKGNLWFGTGAEGVYKYDGKLFTQFTMKDGLSSNCVWSIMEDKMGNIWFGTSQGICRSDGNKIISVPISIYIRPVITDNSYYTEWSTKNAVWSMLQDKSGKIWFGTGDGVYFYDGINFTRFLANDGTVNKDSLHLKVVAEIVEDKNEIIWFFSGIFPGNEGIGRYDGKTIERIKPRENGWNRNAFESKNGNLIVATRHYGIWIFDGKSFVDYLQPKELIKPSLNYILEDKTGNLWVASDYGKTEGDTLGGLWHSNISSSNPTEKTFTKIFNKEVYFILEDKDNNIWFSTRNMGLYRYDRKILTKFSE